MSRWPDVRGVVLAHLEDYAVDSVVLLGEGLDNTAYLVNDELIVRFSKASSHQERAARVRREASLLAVVARLSPLAVPVPRFTVAEHGCLAYFKLPGVPVRDLAPPRRLAHAASIGAALGRFLGAMHAVPSDLVADLVDTDADAPAEWLRDAVEAYPHIAAQVPPGYRRAVEAFLEAAPPEDCQAVVFSHNDLGIEHVLVDPATGSITGIIDWSDAALDDPAYDFGLLYRDLGPLALDAALGSYRTDRTDVTDLARLRRRAVFYARCSVFEDLAYGVETGKRSYIENGVAALQWLFPRTGALTP